MMVGMFLGAIAAHADEAPSLRYECVPMDENMPYEIKKFEVELSADAMRFTLKDDPAMNPRENVADYRHDPKYAPRLPKMKPFDRFKHVKLVSGQEFGEGPMGEFYVEKSLRHGGRRLREGQFGGVVMTAGWGYSWARSMCVLMGDAQ